MSEDVFERYKLFIFDADGTLRRTTAPGKPCPHGPGEWELLPGIRETLGPIPWGRPWGPRLGLASNQDQIAYGYLTVDMARRLLRDLAIAATGTAPPEPALQLCPHALDATCDCRKPRPGMLLRIMEHYGMKPGATVFVGNHEVDREAAERAGVAFVWSEGLFQQPGGWASDHPQ
jgi:D-glycero-D-manno-heptose 1,7-bisphosphate phosphatase